MRPQHSRFVAEYACDWNATAAYKRAGFRARGHAAEVNASRLLRRPDVAQAVRAVEQAMNAACQAEIERRTNRPIRIRGLGWFAPGGGQRLQRLRVR
jgi:phage terminase small subunit